MDDPAPVLAPAVRSYRGSTTDPLRWATWSPRKGDILVCTPPKCGTTWTQTMLAMLVNGSSDLPEKVPVLSPWVDADLGVSADEVAATLAAQKGRRVVKTHTPADGFPIWDGVTVIAVYRHPLDVFFSLRKHEANKSVVMPDHPMSLPVPDSIRRFINGPADPDDFDKDTLASLSPPLFRNGPFRTLSAPQRPCTIRTCCATAIAPCKIWPGQLASRPARS